MQFQSAAVLLGAVASALANPVARTPADVLNAIAALGTALTTLDNLITAYPLTGGTLSGALAIHNAAVAALNALNNANTVATAEGPVASPDADAILAAILAIEPTINHALTQIVAKKPAFVALPVGGIPALVKQDLINLRAATATFSDTLIANSPVALQPDGIAYKTRVLAAIDAAIAAY